MKTLNEQSPASLAKNGKTGTFQTVKKGGSDVPLRSATADSKRIIKDSAESQRAALVRLANR